MTNSRIAKIAHNYSHKPELFLERLQVVLDDSYGVELELECDLLQSLSLDMAKKGLTLRVITDTISELKILILHEKGAKL